MGLRAGLLLPALLLSGVAGAAECQTFDRSPACCPHAPPVCCPADLASTVDDMLVAQACGGAGAPKGQSQLLDECRHYYGHDDVIGEVLTGRQPAATSAFDAMRARLTSPRAQVASIAVAGAQHAFIVRNVTETGALERTAAWALVGGEMIHVEAEVEACTAPQVEVLLARMIERLHDGKSMKTTSVPPKRPSQ